MSLIYIVLLNICLYLILFKKGSASRKFLGRLITIFFVLGRVIQWQIKRLRINLRKTFHIKTIFQLYYYSCLYFSSNYKTKTLLVYLLWILVPCVLSFGEFTDFPISCPKCIFICFFFQVENRNFCTKCTLSVSTYSTLYTRLIPIGKRFYPYSGYS